MKAFAFIFFISISIMASTQTLKQQLLQQDTTLTDVEIIKCKYNKQLFIAILVYSPDWWEDICVLKFQNRKIIWKAKFYEPPVAQSIRSAKQIALKGINNPLIEIFDQTHIGNGNYYLYELEGKNLRLVATTKAVDKNKDYETGIALNSTIFKGEQLTPIYIDANKDGVDDILLKGTIQIIDKHDHIIKQYPAQKILLYNKNKKMFIEDTALTKGFGKE